MISWIELLFIRTLFYRLIIFKLTWKNYGWNYGNPKMNKLQLGFWKADMQTASITPSLPWTFLPSRSFRLHLLAPATFAEGTDFLGTSSRSVYLLAKHLLEYRSQIGTSIFIDIYRYFLALFHNTVYFQFLILRWCLISLLLTIKRRQPWITLSQFVKIQTLHSSKCLQGCHNLFKYQTFKATTLSTFGLLHPYAVCLSWCKMRDYISVPASILSCSQPLNIQPNHNPGPQCFFVWHYLLSFQCTLLGAPQTFRPERTNNNWSNQYFTHIFISYLKFMVWCSNLSLESVLNHFSSLGSLYHYMYLWILFTLTTQAK